ncbi:hypothetical protein DFA_07468 [Cavenderia fasciculata]|uniref:GGDEF domain-containing protein n=1 Tax=Cavenderia fasciculata TaxID=261658 RepID=F4PWI0_CACFS|nr:uncharacterized protein DFA_07468 [Cavenderia fasciculata]EGG20344.1 hypothetical protein DFA_07468 [Cavenderia fasciculata]|eukprot:XP_004367327.1 hypothetical protein DFA_07468 [Cavenderia fasciculata]
MAIEIINFNQLIQRQSSLDRFPTTLFPTNYFYIAFCIIVFLYTIQKRDKKSSSRFMEILSSNQSISILEINFNNRIVRTNNSSVSLEQFCQSYVIDSITLQNNIISSMNQFSPSDVQIKSKSCSSYYRLTGKYDASTNVFQGIMIDNTQEKQQLNKLKNTLTHDALTGLQNRYHLNNKIQKFCAKSSSEQCSIYFIDLNKFKQINDTHGHDNGDVVLRSVADRFQQFADESVLPVRLSGDEFLIVKRNVESNTQADQFISSYLSSVQCDTVQLNNSTSIKVTLSFGGVVFNKSQSTQTDKLIKCADERMYQMKKNLLPNGNSTVTFTA